MPALAEDIAAGMRAARIETWSDAAIHGRYLRARDGSDEPAAGYFDVAANALTVITARGALIGVERRRFTVEVSDLIWPSPASGIPTLTLTDPEQSASAAALVTRIEVNLEREVTIFEVMV